MAASDSNLESVPGFKVSIAWPRLSFLELVAVGQVAVGVSAFPVISHLRALKSSPRLWETWMAATHWPRFLKPLQACGAVRPVGSSFERLSESLVFWDNN